MKAYKIPEKPSASIFNLPCVGGCMKREDGIVYTLMRYVKDGIPHEVRDNGKFIFFVFAVPGDWLVFDEENHVWHVLTEEEYRKFNK